MLSVSGLYFPQSNLTLRFPYLDLHNREIKLVGLRTFRNDSIAPQNVEYRLYPEKTFATYQKETGNVVLQSLPRAGKCFYYFFKLLFLFLISKVFEYLYLNIIFLSINVDENTTYSPLFLFLRYFLRRRQYYSYRGKREIFRQSGSRDKCAANIVKREKYHLCGLRAGKLLQQMFHSFWICTSDPFNSLIIVCCKIFISCINYFISCINSIVAKNQY